MMTINTLWLGNKLRPLEQLCLLSMQLAGHPVRLWTYGPVDGVPEGIELAPAADIVKRDQFLIHAATNSPALGSNVFRYRLMEGEHGIWMDSDVLLLKSVIPQHDHVYGWESTEAINNAVLLLPRSSPVLTDLLDYVNADNPIPPWYTERQIQKWAENNRTVSTAEWGIFGPKALTWFTKKNSLQDIAQPQSVFYPVPYSKLHAPFHRDWDISSMITDDTVALHLWNNGLRGPSRLRKHNPAGKLVVDEGSFVERWAKTNLGFRLASE